MKDEFSEWIIIGAGVDLVVETSWSLFGVSRHSESVFLMALGLDLGLMPRLFEKIFFFLNFQIKLYKDYIAYIYWEV